MLVSIYALVGVHLAVVFMVNHIGMEIIDGNHVLLKLRVASADMGKVIGKQGRIAKAMRTVVKAAASCENKKVTVDIIE